MPSSVRIDRRGAVADLVIDRAQVHNAFDDALIAELAAARQIRQFHKRVRPR